MYRFALRPRWIIAHIVIAAIAVLFVNLGFWQLRRLDQRRADNALLAARTSEPPLTEPPAGDAEVYRRLTITGTYDTGREVLLYGRALNGAAGHHLLTPLVTDGRAIIVDRGWVPFDQDRVPNEHARPPAGAVRVSGVLRASQPHNTFGMREPPAGTIKAVSRIDVPRLARQLPYPVAPLWLQLTEQEPAQSAPVAVALPKPDDGPHLDYAIQWFGFTLVGLVGYVFVLRRAATRGAAPAP